MPSQSVANELPAVRALVFIGIVILVFLARSVYTTLPEMHDARKKWDVANEFVQSGDPNLLLKSEHHSSRWGVMIPTVIALKINGNNLITYYSLCLLMYAVFFSMMLQFARRDIPFELLGVFAVLLFYEPMFFRASVQLQPFVFGMFYLALALWALVRFLDSARPSMLILSALMSFFAYGTKETYLLFVVGLCLLLLWKSGIRHTIYYCLVLLALFALETLIFNTLSGYLTFGRIEFLSESKHMDKMPGREMDGVVDYLTRRWILLPPFDKVVSVIAAGTVVYLVATRNLGKLHPATIGIVLMAVSYSLLVTLFPLSIDPLVPIQPLKVKYLTPLMPLVVFVVVLGVSFAVNRAPRPMRKSLVLSLNLMALVFLAWSVIFESPFKYQFRHKQYPAKDALLWKYDELKESLRAGYGVCARKAIPVIKVQNMIRNYMNQDGIIEEIELSRTGQYKILRLRNLDPAKLPGYFHHSDLEHPIKLEDCDSRK